MSVIHKSPRTRHIQKQGPFTIHFNLPGHNLPDAQDHGYGPLAAIAESILEPGTLIGFHPHYNDEIVSWVPGGVMRHNDRTVGELIADPNHLLVMNAGSGFWHEEQTLKSDPHLRMLQIFVRPHTVGLEPRIQHGLIAAPVSNEWRHLFGPEGSAAPFTVRNDVHLHDIRLSAGTTVALPQAPEGWHTYFYVFTGAVSVTGDRFTEAETGLIVGSDTHDITAEEESVVVAFLINPAAKITRVGTIGR